MQCWTTIYKLSRLIDFLTYSSTIMVHDHLNITHQHYWNIRTNFHCHILVVLLLWEKVFCLFIVLSLAWVKHIATIIFATKPHDIYIWPNSIFAEFWNRHYRNLFQYFSHRKLHFPIHDTFKISHSPSLTGVWNPLKQIKSHVTIKL